MSPLEVNAYVKKKNVEEMEKSETQSLIRAFELTVHS